MANQSNVNVVASFKSFKDATTFCKTGAKFQGVKSLLIRREGSTFLIVPNATDKAIYQLKQAALGKVAAPAKVTTPVRRGVKK